MNVADVRRLGKNLHGYLGETIDIGCVLAQGIAAAAEHGWRIEQIPVIEARSLIALTRAAQHPNAAARVVPRVYVSTGIHGDEPAGPLAIREMLRQDLWPGGIDLWICPCLNPDGFTANTRENPGGLDLNRQYFKPIAAETLAHIRWLEQQPAFDLTLCVHEDWESNGFYVYELNPDGRLSLAETIVEAVAGVCPIDRSDLIEGRPARDGIIRPNLDPHSRPDWPEAFFLITNKTRVSYTLEAPSDFPLPVRVSALVQGITAALGKVSREAI